MKVYAPDEEPDEELAPAVDSLYERFLDAFANC